MTFRRSARHGDDILQGYGSGPRANVHGRSKLGTTLVPAFCDACGTAFPSPVSVAQDAKVLTFERVAVEPCPKCGKLGHTPDGLFAFAKEVLDLVAAPSRTADELTRLVQVLRDAQARAQGLPDVVPALRREVPSLAGASELLGRAEPTWHARLALLLSGATLAVGRLQRGRPAAGLTVHQVVEHVPMAPPVGSDAVERVVSSEKTGRNAPCPCGSGKKHKHCCAKPS